jgi:uncharacterized protein YndB with AHSA1/START domain
MAARSKPNEIRITRVYDAPVALVWDAWTDSKKAAKWWGPRGFTITTHSKDLRVGGNWHYTMHGPDGTDYENTTKYLEVEKHARLVYDHGGHADRPPLFRVTVTFSESKGKTTMDMTMALATAEAAQETKKFIKQANGNSTWDRLAEYLDKEASGKERFVINRTFDAPIALMYEVWTDPKHFEKWLPPTGFDMKFIRSDIRAGGSTFYVMSNASGLKMYGRAEYLEMQKPNRIVYTQQFCDEKENLTRHPMAPTWPATMQTTVTLAEEGPDQTRVTIEWDIHGAATPEEVDTFVKGRTGMTMGWTGSFDKLENYLAARAK